MLQVISLLLENKPGALMRVTGLLSARGYNIESLTVARTLDPELSRMTIVVDVDPKLRAQVIKQMNKLINVLQATDLTEAPAVRRELVLLRVRADAGEPHGGPEGSRDLRRARGRFLDRRLRARSHRRSGEAGRVHRRDAQLRRDRSDALRPGRDVARSQETASWRRRCAKKQLDKQSNSPEISKRSIQEWLNRYYEKDGNLATAEGQDGRDHRLRQPGTRARAEPARFRRRRGGRPVSAAARAGPRRKPPA